MSVQYHTTTIDPPIPVTDMTPLEKMVLPEVYETKCDELLGVDRIYFYHCDDPERCPCFSASSLRSAIIDSAYAADPHNYLLTLTLAALDGPHVDETPITLVNISPIRVFQDIVRRSPTVEQVKVKQIRTSNEMTLDEWFFDVCYITSRYIELIDVSRKV